MRLRKLKLVPKPAKRSASRRKWSNGSAALLGLGLLFLGGAAAALAHPMAYGSWVRLGRRSAPAFVASEGNAMAGFGLLFLFCSLFCLLAALRTRRSS